MSILARVFVVMNLILSVVFFGTSAALFKTRLDWRKAYNDIKDETTKSLEELKTRNGEIVRKVGDLETTIIGLRASETQLSKQSKQLTEDLGEAQKKIQVAQATTKSATDVSQQLTKNLEAKDGAYASLQEQLEKTKSELGDAVEQRLQAVQRFNSIALDLEKAQTELSDARKEYQVLTSRFDSIKLQLDVAIGQGFNVKGAVRPVDGLVTAVESSERLVVLSVGQDQKVEPGYEFTIYRGESFIGKVKVIKVFPDLSGAQIIFTKDGEEIQKGDKASTSI